MKCINTLLQSTKDKRCGNHSVRFTSTSRKFLYHWTVICEINYRTKSIIIDNGGFATPSTTRAINAYLKNPVIVELIDREKFELKDLRG